MDNDDDFCFDFGVCVFLYSFVYNFDFFVYVKGVYVLYND